MDHETQDSLTLLMIMELYGQVRDLTVKNKALSQMVEQQQQQLARLAAEAPPPE